MQLNILLSNVASFMKRRLIELFGLILIALCFLFTFTLAFYSPESTTLIYKAEGAQDVNIFYYYSNVTADFFLQSFGLMSFVIGICILSWGINLIINKKIENLLAKSFYLCASLFFGCLFVYSSFNNSFWLIDNGNSGFVGERSYSFFINFFPIIENEYFKISFLILALVFFILSSSINFIKIFKFFQQIIHTKNITFYKIERLVY